MHFQDSVAIVTGGGAGIGCSVAQALASEGVRVVVADLDLAAAEAVAEGIRDRGEHAIAVATDMSNAADVRELFRLTEETYARLDVLVNNAGVALGSGFPSSSEEDWLRVIEVNLIGPMRAIQLAIKPMTRGGGGCIVNVSSRAALGLDAHDAPDYAATKAALVRLTSSLTGLHRATGIRVHAICPDWVRTPAVERTREHMTAEEWREVAPERLVEPIDLAREILALARDEGASGRVLNCPADEAWHFLAQFGS